MYNDWWEGCRRRVTLPGAHGVVGFSPPPSYCAATLTRPWGGVKTLRRVWDHESDPWLSPLSTKPSQGVRDVQGGGRCEEWVGNHVLCEPTGSSVSTPGFTPGSLSHSIVLHHRVLVINS